MQTRKVGQKKKKNSDPAARHPVPGMSEAESVGHFHQGAAQLRIKAIMAPTKVARCKVSAERGGGLGASSRLCICTKNRLALPSPPS